MNGLSAYVTTGIATIPRDRRRLCSAPECTACRIRMTVSPFAALARSVRNAARM